MKTEWIPKGICSKKISVEIEGGLVKQVEFAADVCPGNGLALPILIQGQPAAEVAAKLKGVPCGRKATSCADQLARAIDENLRLQEQAA